MTCIKKKSRVLGFYYAKKQVQKKNFYWSYRIIYDEFK